MAHCSFMLQHASSTAAVPGCMSNMQSLSSPFSVYVMALASGMPSSSVIRLHELTAFQYLSPPASSPSSSSTAAAPTITSNPSYPPASSWLSPRRCGQRPSSCRFQTWLAPTSTASNARAPPSFDFILPRYICPAFGACSSFFFLVVLFAAAQVKSHLVHIFARLFQLCTSSVNRHHTSPLPPHCISLLTFRFHARSHRLHQPTVSLLPLPLPSPSHSSPPPPHSSASLVPPPSLPPTPPPSHLRSNPFDHIRRHDCQHNVPRDRLLSPAASFALNIPCIVNIATALQAFIRHRGV